MTYTDTYTCKSRHTACRTSIGRSVNVPLEVISEQVGIAKPHRDIFDHALTRMGNPARNRVLMVGDNPDSDILGGINAGLDTCWVNVDGRQAPEGVVPTMQVASLGELERRYRFVTRTFLRT